MEPYVEICTNGIIISASKAHRSVQTNHGGSIAGVTRTFPIIKNLSIVHVIQEGEGPS